MPANKYDYFAASLPMLKADGSQGLSVQAFLDDCEQQLTSADFQALTAARLGAEELSSHAIARAWQQHDREVRNLQAGEALFKLHWQFLDSLVPTSFLDLDYLTVYYLKLQLLERQQSFNYEAGHEVLEQVRSGLASFGSYTKRSVGIVISVILLLIGPASAWASAGGSALGDPDFTASGVGYLCVLIFVCAYILVMSEEYLHLRKSKPVLVAAGLIWLLTAWALQSQGYDSRYAEQAVKHNILEYAELFLFLLVAMTYINTMEERQVFEVLRVWLVNRGFSLRGIFWITGLLAFFISPVADNLTTALLMGAVCMSVGAGNKKFVSLACLNVVVAANAGGAFSPFGDITTLMVWQKGIIPFQGFLVLFLPSAVSWLVPAGIMSLTLGKEKPAPIQEKVYLQPGAFVVVGLFLCTIATAVSFYNFFHLPPVLGMMTGLGVLQFYGYYLKRKAAAAFIRGNSEDKHTTATTNPFEAFSHKGAEEQSFDIFRRLEKAEWDTLMFFYGVILCVGGLSTLGYMRLVSAFAYDGYGATTANIAVGFLSAIVDNIPVMFAVLTMAPEMDTGQWLLVTLTAGVGGSMLSIGSAAGVALMGQARGVYTFFSHLKWSWAIVLGYALSIWVHCLINMDGGPPIPIPGKAPKAEAHAAAPAAVGLGSHGDSHLPAGENAPAAAGSAKAPPLSPPAAGDSAAADAVPGPTLSGEATKPEIGGVKRAAAPP